MAELSPFLNSSPTDKAFTLGLMSREQNRALYDAVELSVYVGGKLALTSGSMRLTSLKNHQSERTVYRRRGEKIRGYVTYTRFLKLFPYRVVVPFPANFRPIGNTGRVVISLSGAMTISSGILRKARARAVGFAKSPYRRSVSVPQPSQLRVSPETVNRQFLRTFENGVGGVRTSFSQTVVPVLSYQRTWTGSRTPNWGKLKPGQFPVNPHTVKIVEVLEDKYSKYQVQAASGNWELNVYPYTEVYTPPLSPIAIHLPLAEQNAIRRLIEQCEAGIQANLAQNLAQYNQVTSMVAGNATKIVKSLRQLKRFNFTGAINALTAGRGTSGINPNKLSRSKSLASNWLEMQYGWKPLLSDIEGTLKAIPTLTNVGSFVRSVRASANASKEAVVDNFPPGDGLIGFGNGGKTTFLNRTSTKFVIRYRMSNPGLAFAAQTGFTNPINLGWELIPFSFVVDWFLPIGPYLETLTAFQGLTFLSGTRTNFTRVRMDSVLSHAGQAVGEPTVTVNLNAIYRKQEIWLNRVVLSDFPSQVSPSINLRGLEGGQRAANAIALLTQAFRGRG